MKIICILFHAGKDRDKLSLDSIRRLLAGAEIAKKNRETKVLFVGGGGLKISGAKLMAEYWVKNLAELKNQYTVLDSSNNTFGNLEEIKFFIKNNGNKKSEVSIVSNEYHGRRLNSIVKKNSLDVKILSAEKILLGENENNKELLAYLSSFGYKKKVILEQLLYLYSLLDSQQKIVRLWRYFSYKKMN